MALEVKNLVKTYGEKTVVNDISFSMKTPGVYALLGTNGAGKTTTIRMILSMLSKDSGEVLWNGEALDTMKTNVGYLAEERGLYPKYSLMDQLLYFAGLKNISKDEAKKRIKYWSDRLEVNEYVYSKTKNKVKSMNADQQKEKYIIMSSHQMPTIEEFCSDITIMNRGNAVLQGDLNEIKKQYGRVNMYFKSDEDAEDIISRFDFADVIKNANEYEIKVKDEGQAKDFLGAIVSKGINVVKFELREPTLHEIFVEKVGESNDK